MTKLERLEDSVNRRLLKLKANERVTLFVIHKPGEDIALVTAKAVSVAAGRKSKSLTLRLSTRRKGTPWVLAFSEQEALATAVLKAKLAVSSGKAERSAVLTDLCRMKKAISRLERDLAVLERDRDNLLMYECRYMNKPL